jgi:sugar lactone lactonase YvrE
MAELNAKEGRRRDRKNRWTMSILQVTRALDVKAELGECPLWCVEEQCLYWLDILGSTINRFDPRSGNNSVWSLPAVPGCFAFRDGGGAVIAAQDGMYDITFATGHIERVYASAHDPRRLRFNDGRTDREGRLWVGTVRADKGVDIGETAYYKFDGRSIEKMIASIGTANGTAFSPDGKTMYRAQTLDRLIFAYDYDSATGTPSRERVFAAVPRDLGMPDGATVDTESGYWVALLAGPQGGKAGIARYTPDGRLDLYVEVPVPLPTMVAFGGADMSMLFVTSGRMQDWVQYQVPDAAGSIFCVQTSFRGVPETKFHYV